MNIVFVFYIKDYKGKNELVAFCEDIVYTLESVLDIDRINGGIGIVEIDEGNKHDVEQLLKDLLIASEKAINTFDRDFDFCFFLTQKWEAQLIREEEIKRELAEIIADENDNRLFLHFQANF